MRGVHFHGVQRPTRRHVRTRPGAGRSNACTPHFAPVKRACFEGGHSPTLTRHAVTEATVQRRLTHSGAAETRTQRRLAYGVQQKPGCCDWDAVATNSQQLTSSGLESAATALTMSCICGKQQLLGYGGWKRPMTSMTRRGAASCLGAGAAAGCDSDAGSDSARRHVRTWPTGSYHPSRIAARIPGSRARARVCVCVCVCVRSHLAHRLVAQVGREVLHLCV